jgi:hypothetical protein
MQWLVREWQYLLSAYGPHPKVLGASTPVSKQEGLSMTVSQFKVVTAPAVLNPDGSIGLSLAITVTGVEPTTAQKVVALENDVANLVKAALTNQGVFVEVMDVAAVVSDVTALK